MVTIESGLQYKDIKVDIVHCFPMQVAANYVAMVPNGQIFDRFGEKATWRKEDIDGCEENSSQLVLLM
ncbi:hypothetical protein EJB05_47256, partial [Eragrostis curvula]